MDLLSETQLERKTVEIAVIDSPDPSKRVIGIEREQIEKKFSIDEIEVKPKPKNNDFKSNKRTVNSNYNNNRKSETTGPESAINKFENNFDRSKRRSFFTIAKENASNRLFQMLKLSPEDLTNFFSIEQDEYGNGVANREEYSWVYKTTGDFNIIPLDGYIQQPSKYVDGKRVPIVFYVAWFFKESEFLKRCKNYYRKYNIDFRIVKLKTPDLWKIILKVVDPNSIIIRAEQ